jgi:hypothetical protein
VSEFLVEVYRSRTAAEYAPCSKDVPGVATELAHDDAQVQLLRSIFVPEDEMCLYHFEARSGEAVREAATRLGLRVERIVEAVSESGVSK